MCRKITVLCLVLGVFAGTAQVTKAALITEVKRLNPDDNSGDTAPAIAPALLSEAAPAMVDRTHQYKTIPEALIDAEYIMVANDDKDNARYELHVTIAKDATLYLFIDNRIGTNTGGQATNPNVTAAGMTWVTDMGFTDTGLNLAIDENADGSINNWFSVFSKKVSPGVIILKAQNDASTGGPGGRNMYGVAAAGPKVKARKPDPPDGAPAVTMPLLQWTPGDTAMWHDVYFGTTATLGPANLVTHLPVNVTMYYHTPGIVPGTTYYWRVDETEADMTTVNTGDVWSFTAAPVAAYSPNPKDGARWVKTDSTLTWLPGTTAVKHDVYFGTNEADVTAGTGGTFKGTQAAMIYKPPALAEKTTYYWRVDEVESNGTTKHKGEVWKFTTLAPGGGIKGQYFNNMNLSGVPALTRVDSSINFNWGDPGSPDPVIPNDSFSVRWTGELEIAFTETYTFITNSDDGVRLWVDNQSIVNNWTNHSATENRGTIDLVGGQTYSIVLEYYESTGGAVIQLSWESPSTPRQPLAAGPLQLPLRAAGPSPRAGAVDVTQTPNLHWTAGDKAAKHDVFFGTDETAVANATTSTTGIYKGRQDLTATSYLPGTLEWDTTYYWRVDEVNTASADSPWIGTVWSFTTADFVVVDDFEDYNNFSPYRVFQTWIDGLGYNEPPPGNLGNGSGAVVGHDIWTATSPYYGGNIVDTAIVHVGGQSMPMDYNNVDSPYYSETERTWTTPQNWTVNGVKALTVWYRGLPGSVGSLSYDAGTRTYTMTGSGADIFGTADQFHFAFKRLSGNGSIVAKVLSVQETHLWAKAGVMIRATLDPNSAFAGLYIAPGYGCRFQARLAGGQSATSDTGVTQLAGIRAPHWIKLERIGNTFSAYDSNDPPAPDGAGTDTWHPLAWNPQTIPMGASVYIGLAVTAHNAAATCEAKFSNVSVTGAVTPVGLFTTSHDIGIAGNDAEPLYVAIQDTTGNSKAAPHPDPAAVQKNTWQEWNTPLSAFTGVKLNSVKKMYIGVGNKASPKIGGTGSLYFDDIRLYQPRCVPSMGKPAADVSGDCVVDYLDLEMLADQWLKTIPPATTLSADLNADKKVDLKDYAAMAKAWLEEILWP